MKKLLWLTVLVMVALILVSPASSPAGGSRVFFGVNVGVGPAYWGYGYGYRGYGYWGPRYWGPGVWWGPSAWWGAPYYYPAPATAIQQPPVWQQFLPLISKLWGN